MWKANELRSALAREGQLAADLDAARARIASLEDQVPRPAVSHHRPHVVQRTGRAGHRHTAFHRPVTCQVNAYSHAAVSCRDKTYSAVDAALVAKRRPHLRTQWA